LHFGASACEDPAEGRDARVKLHVAAPSTFGVTRGGKHRLVCWGGGARCDALVLRTAGR
jgi:hypothetical protein